MAYVQIMLTDAAVIHSSLAELGPDFVICHAYDLVRDERQAERIAEFLSPTDVVARSLQSALVDGVRQRISSDENLTYEHADAVTERLQEKLDILQMQFCNT